MALLDFRVCDFGGVGVVRLGVCCFTVLKPLTALKPP